MMRRDIPDWKADGIGKILQECPKSRVISKMPQKGGRIGGHRGLLEDVFKEIIGLCHSVFLACSVLGNYLFKKRQQTNFQSLRQMPVTTAE
jgi:hypothetical protein